MNSQPQAHEMDALPTELLDQSLQSQEKLGKFKYTFPITTKPEGAWPNLSSNQGIRANLVYIVSLVKTREAD